MTTSRTPNHPAIVSGLFEAIEQSSAPTTRGNQYGLVQTSSFLQCSGLKFDKSENFQITLQTNTALTNVLELRSLYYLSGRMIALNDGTTPVLTYNHDTLATVIETAPENFDFINRATLTGLGVVTHRQEVATDNADSGNNLEARSHRKFTIKYIIPGSRYFIKTHPIYQVGREVHIVGRIVDFEMESHIAVVLVTSVSLTSGHQAVKPNPPGLATPSGSGGRQITTFTGPLAATTPSIPAEKSGFSTPSPARQSKKKNKTVKVSSPSPNESVSKKLKGKAKAPVETDSESNDSTSDSDSDDTEVDEAEPPPKLPKRGRPRREVVKQAAKTMPKK
ncbi:hypothetical protein PSHT_00382 [Puccinia striiformis]|uniref:Uncharacterized protein n=1 Tax=Puccinia striiformis TaxID=27350 RepID=A0A2S4WN91_9BASI|nr:hypothetical protein PSHT_00382 [Puccinia striiformis]